MLIHPVYSSGIIIQDLTIRAPVDSPNTDGINLESPLHTMMRLLSTIGTSINEELNTLLLALKIHEEKEYKRTKDIVQDLLQHPKQRMKPMNFVKFLTPEFGLQGYWDPYPIDMEFRPPCMV
ncbi:hypothetical protein L1987_80619 [Smallanthus sonchifolius]|uniref:Uncharacterized protein n=1 Tax=Smallanthus sonchifolius TaxID=185202 RepID=A0ACB8YNL5_9ASTR|nr:hypothetical protein L1987_80619 [Smallanthus sonchifolius]